MPEFPNFAADAVAGELEAAQRELGAAIERARGAWLLPTIAAIEGIRENVRRSAEAILIGIAEAVARCIAPLLTLVERIGADLREMQRRANESNPLGAALFAARHGPDRFAAAERAARLLMQRWRPHRDVKAGLRRRADNRGVTYEAVKLEALTSAVMLVVGDGDEPTTVRLRLDDAKLGSEWLLTRAGGRRARKALVSPSRLPIGWFWRWQATMIRKVAGRDVLSTDIASLLDSKTVPLPDHAAPDALDAPATPDMLSDERQTLLALLDDAKISDHQRTVALLVWGDGVPQSEAARRLGMAPGTVKTHLHRARRRIHERHQSLPVWL
jgi:DNA-binding CsgD family transcriptional regulator